MKLVCRCASFLPRLCRTSLPLLLGLLVPGPASAQKCLHPDFRVELIGQPPEIEHPSVVTCDDQGNLYVGEDPMDMRGPTTKEFDRIIRLEFNPDGTVKKRTVFAENLGAVFGLVWKDGALHVMHAPHYSILRDKDGDGVAEERKDVAEGFGPPAGVYGFNDHIVTGTQLGMDGLIYVSVGDKGVPKATGADGSVCSLEGGGVVRFRPDGTQLEVFSSGTRNHLDVPMDSLDNIFTYDNTDDGLGWWTRFTHHVPTGYYGYPYDYHPHPERHLPRIAEFGGGSPVGADCYREDGWPAKYRDGVFYCEWGKRKIQLFTVKRNGASFDATMEDFLVPEEGSEFRPQDVCFSPDGKSMYVADWNFGGWVQPKVLGRLYRVTYVGKDAPEQKPRVANDAPVAEQIAALGHAARSERMRAQWKLASLGQEAVEPVRKGLRDPKAALMARVHAIWTLNALIESVPGFDPTGDWIEALKDPEADVRAQAARALGERLASSVPSVVTTTEIARRSTSPQIRNPAAVAQLVAALHDTDASVRLQAAVALGRIGDAAAAAPLFAALKDADQYARFAVVQALRAIGEWKTAQSVGPSLFGGTVLAATNVYSPAAIAVLKEVLAKEAQPEVQIQAIGALADVAYKGDSYVKGWWGTQPAKGKPPRAKTHAWEGTDEVLAALRAAIRHPNSEVRVAAVEAQQSLKDPEALKVVREMAASDSDEAVRREVMTFLGAMKDTEAVPTLLAIARQGDGIPALRAKAVETLQAIGGEEASKAYGALLDDAQVPAPVRIAALRAIEGRKVREDAALVERQLGHPDADVRSAAAACLAVVEGKTSAGKLIPLLADPDHGVRRQTLKALAAAGANDAVPEMQKLVDQKETQTEARLALAQLVDRRALAVYLEGLTDRNPDVRNACGVAVNTLRPSIGDDLRELNKRNELTPNVRRELGGLFATPAPIQKWDFLGSWSKEAAMPAFDFANAPQLDAPVKVGDKELRWKGIVSGHPRGMVEPGQHCSSRDNVWAMAYAAIESKEGGTIAWRAGSDDQAIIYVNGEKVLEQLGDRGWSPDQAKGQATLKPGVNHVWFQTGNSGGPWQFSLAVGGPDPAFAFLYENVAPQLDLAAFRDFAAKNAGNVERGEKLFFDKNGIGCVKCHSIGDKGEAKVGPNLLGVGQKYPREELVRSVLEPSNRIVSGYELTVIVTSAGQVVQGIVKSETEEGVELTQADAKVVTIKKSEIDDQTRSNISAMPNGLEKGMSLADFADIVAYLEAQKQAAPKP